MTILTPEEIRQYHSVFTTSPEALEALGVIQECHGNLDDAILLLLVRDTGEEPDRGLRLDALAQRCRAAICQAKTEDVLELLNVVAPFLPPPMSLATPVVLYVAKIGVKYFCASSQADS